MNIYNQLVYWGSHLEGVSLIRQERFGLAQQVVAELLRSRLKAQEEDRRRKDCFVT